MAGTKLGIVQSGNVHIGLINKSTSVFIDCCLSKSSRPATRFLVRLSNFRISTVLPANHPDNRVYFPTEVPRRDSVKSMCAQERNDVIDVETDSRE